MTAFLIFFHLGWDRNPAQKIEDENILCLVELIEISKFSMEIVLRCNVSGEIDAIYLMLIEAVYIKSFLKYPPVHIRNPSNNNCTFNLVMKSIDK